MGLDMYFELQKRNTQYNENVEYPSELSDFSDYIKTRGLKYCTKMENYSVGYFRKFNALHGYIMYHFCDGEDTCEPVYITKYIDDIIEVLTRVSENHDDADEYLPTCDGCFFGSTEYDDEYFEDVDEALKMFKMIKDNGALDTYDVIYQASW